MSFKMEIDPTSTVIVDNGALHLKASLMHHPEPRFFRSFCGRPKQNATDDDYLFDNALLGAMRANKSIEIMRAFKLGKIHDWDHIEALWQNLYSDLLPMDTPPTGMILTLNPHEADKGKSLELLFEVH